MHRFLLECVVGMDEIHHKIYVAGCRQGDSREQAIVHEQLDLWISFQGWSREQHAPPSP